MKIGMVIEEKDAKKIIARYFNLDLESIIMVNSQIPKKKHYNIGLRSPIPKDTNEVRK